ncbi:MAG: cupredoxin domain-containing protein, partial [Actinomycetota bacterium]
MRRPALLLLAVFAAGGCGAETDDSPPVASIDVVAGDDFFDPDRLSAPEGRVEFIVANRGQNPHTFVIEGIGFKLRVFEPGELDSGVVRLEPGQLAVYCDIEGHREAGMEGVLVV